MKMPSLFLILSLLLVACGPRPNPPKTPLEFAEQAAVAIKQSTITIKNLSCNRTNWDVEKANCKLPGRPLSPDQGLAALDQLKTAQDGLATALAIPAGGVGDCLGQQRSQLQCLVAVQNLALEIQRRAMQ